MSYGGVGGNDLEGNIALGGDDNQQNTAQEESKNGFQPENQASGSSGGVFGDELNTLDEPVMDTIKRDLTRIWQKLKIVINPFVQIDNEEKRREIRNWDLWGPFFFCLMLAIVLSTITNADDNTLLFETVFCIVWLGGAVIAING